MVKKKAGAKAARPADMEEEPDQSGEDLTDETSPEDRRRKLPATKTSAAELGRVLPADKSSSEKRPGKLPATTDQQQGKTGTSSDDINPTDPGRHTAYSKGVNTTEAVNAGGNQPERFYAYVMCEKTDIIHLVRTHEADFTVELNDKI